MNNNSLSIQAVVVAGYSGIPGALIEGKPTFGTISAALEMIPKANRAPFVIYIRKGRYYEKINVNHAQVCFWGESRTETTITYDASGDTLNPYGEAYGTWGCATLTIKAPDFQAANLTLENGFDYPSNAAKSDADPTKSQRQQAVALMTTLESDRTIIHNCRVVGYQDTLFANVGRHYFQQCQILGHVDFIFGAGQAIFDDCDIVSRDRKGQCPTGYVTAPSTPISYPYGFVFADCRLLKENRGIPPGSVRLGRPWHPQADPQVSGSAVFIRCYMDDHIGATGYARISSRDAQGQQIWFAVKADSRFFEYGSYGPGAIENQKRPMLDKKAVAWYAPTQVLNGWLPEVKAPTD